MATKRKVETIATLRVDEPFTREDLEMFLGVLPDSARISVTIHEGGSQRDPVPVAYTFVGRW